MPAEPLFKGRSFRLCYWHADPRVVDADRARLEQHLKKVGDVKVDTLKSLDDPGLHACDLLIVAAQTIPRDDFAKWLGGFKERFQRMGAIWVPVLVVADVPFEGLREILPDAARANWYFDIMAPDHVASLPIRVANLLRIHDHLHEMKRYAKTLDDINAKVTALETELTRLRGGSP